MPDRAEHVTRLLLAWTDGRREVLDELMALVYEELRQVAGGLFRRESPGHTLQPTALVHEAFFRLVDQNRVEWKSRAQFFSVAAQVMRRLLIDHARARRMQKRGGEVVRITLVDAPLEEGLDVEQLLALNDALEKLETLDPQQAKVVEMRYFAGMSVEETAAALEISTATVKREWAMARAWLLSELSRP